MAQEVLIEFLADYSSLDRAIDTLEKTGAVDTKVAQAFKSTNAEINKQAQAIKNTSSAFKGPIQSIDQLDKKTKQFVKDFIEGFQEGINEELQRMKPELDALRKKLEDTGKAGTTSTVSLRQELRNLTEQIAATKAAGGPVSPEMIQRAGQLKDAIADASQEIANAGSDTRNIDNVVGSIAALAGGFSAVQGAVGLFTDDTEELQKVLLKVNSAMALATGIQQVANAVQREGSLAKLADTVATKAQIVTQQIYTFVTGKATAATKLFKIALASTGIGLAIILISALAEAFSDTGDEVEDLNLELDTLKARLDGLNRSAARDLDLIVAQAKERGATESETQKLILDGKREELQRTREIIAEQKRLLAEQKAGSKQAETAQVALNTSQQKRLDLINDIAIGEANLAVQLREDAEERSRKQKEENDKRLASAREARLLEFEDFKAGVQLQLLETKKGSVEELELKKKLLNAELFIDLENEKLTQNQKKLLLKEFFRDRKELENQFNRAIVAQAAANEQTRLEGELNNLNLSNEEKLALNISLLEVIAGQEIEAAEGNAAKIKAINQKLSADIATARVNAIKTAAEFELSLQSATGGAARRALERVASDENQKSEIRINAINQLEQAELDSIDRRLQANREASQVQGADQQALNLEYEQLLDQRSQAEENAAQRRVDINKKASDQIQADQIKFVENILETLSEVANTLDALFSLQADKENQHIDEQRRKIKELQEAGAITEKEALQRQKRIDAEERKLKQQQAKRDKDIAVFQALLAVPSAILQGLRQGGPILAAIYGALAAAQAAIVASRPVPKFSKGKKDSYEGPGIVGEQGAELIQRADGTMQIAKKPTLVYVGKKDKIFTHTETKSLIPHVDRSVMRIKESVDKIDYDKLAAAIIKGYKPSPGASINIDKEFISESVANGLLKNNYFDRYYSSK